MARTMTQGTLARENVVYLGSGGRSQEKRGSGFRPAFLDTDTDTDTDIVHPSRLVDGRFYTRDEATRAMQAETNWEMAA